MKLFIFLSVACFVLTSCVFNSNIAWRGQTDTYKYEFDASTDGKIVNTPTATKGDSRIDAAKEYSDAFKSSAEIAAGDGSTAQSTPVKEEQPTDAEVNAPVLEDVPVPEVKEINAPTQEEQPIQK